MKGLYAMILLALLMAGCKDKKTGSSSRIDNVDWTDITLEKTPKAVPLPALCNISEMMAAGSSILLKNEGLETCYALLDASDFGNFVSFGNRGNGPEEVLPSSMPVYGSTADRVKVLNANSIKTYQRDGNGRMSFKEEKKLDKRLDFCQQLYAVNDTLFCVYVYAPRETGIHLVNINTQEVYDSVTVGEGYFDNRDVPFELNFCVHKDRLVIGRVKFNQIEVYHIDVQKKRISPLFVVNYKQASADHIVKNGACYMKNINSDDACFYLLNQDTSRPGKETYIDVYTWQGEPVKRFRLDGLYLDGVLVNGSFYLKKYTDDDNLYVLSLE